MNPHRGEAAIDMGGLTYTLVFDWNALAELEDLSGVTITRLGQLAGQGESALSEIIGVKFIRAAMYAGLKRRHKKLTLEQVGELMTEHDLAYFTVPVMQAMLRAINGAEPESPPAAASPSPTVNGDGAGETL